MCAILLSGKKKSDCVITPMPLVTSGDCPYDYLLSSEDVFSLCVCFCLFFSLEVSEYIMCEIVL